MIPDKDLSYLFVSKVVYIKYKKVDSIYKIRCEDSGCMRGAWPWQGHVSQAHMTPEILSFCFMGSITFLNE